jgi:hypothetical protein
MLLPSSGHAARSDMVEVFEPFEVAHCDTSSVEQNIRQEDNPLFGEDILCTNCSGSVSSFCDNFALEFIGIFLEI